MNSAALALDVRALRPPKRGVDPSRPIAALREPERTIDRGVAPTATIFLAGAECPFQCVFCDLWQWTLETPTPPGLLPQQVRLGLAELGLDDPSGTLLKLYNASNFFDDRAVPPADDAALAELGRPFLRVVVESHARQVGERALAFADRLDGKLEVAVGLETVHPDALARLNKGMTLTDFDRAAKILRRNRLGLRAFVLVGCPFIPPAESQAWTVRSAGHAFAQGARTVTLIPVRGGNGALEALAARGDWAAPTLRQLEAEFEACLELVGGVVQADLWDLERFAECDACFEARRARLLWMNLSGVVEAPVVCETCGSPSR